MWAIIAVALMCAVGAAAPARAAGADSTITAVGFYSEPALADRAAMVVQVTAMGKKNSKLRNRLVERMDEAERIIDSIGQRAVETRVSPMEDVRRPYKRHTRIVGLTQQIRVTCTDIQRFTAIYAALDGLEGVTLSGLDYAVSDDRDANDRLLGLAADDARRQATAIADELGVTLGRAVEVIANTPLRDVQNFYATRSHTLSYWILRSGQGSKPPDEEPPSVNLMAAVTVRFVIR